MYPSRHEEARLFRADPPFPRSVCTRSNRVRRTSRRQHVQCSLRRSSRARPTRCPADRSGRTARHLRADHHRRHLRAPSSIRRGRWFQARPSRSSTKATKDTRTATTDSERGTFQVTGLTPGTYTVRVALQGFGTFERKSVVVELERARVGRGRFALAVGNISDTITVEARGTQVNTEETQHGGVITRTQIEQIQVLGRDVTSLMRLLPGVRYTAPVDSMGGGFGVDVPSVGGLPADWSKVIIDGVVANEVGNSGMNAQMVNLDAIAEVRLLNNSYRAEYGQSGGSQLQIVTRGGTSEYRGSGYYYGRHERFNSTEFFRARNQRAQGIDPFPPTYRFNTWGANLGGPVPARIRRSCSSSTRWKRRCEAPAEPSRRGGCRRRSNGKATSRRRSTRRASSSTSAIRADRPGVQCRDRRTGLLRGQHHPEGTDQPGPHAGHAQDHAAAGVRPADDAGQLQLRFGRSHRHSEAEQRRPDRLAADVERQPLVHLQGLVAGSTRHARHGGALDWRLVPMLTTRTPTGASAATTPRCCGPTSCGTRTSAAGGKPKSSTR